MAKQDAIESLKETIRLLEIRQAAEGEILKAQFKITYESLKLVNLIKTSLKEVTESVDIKNNLFETVVSILTGYLTKKMMINSKSNPVMKILGALLQFGVTKFVAKNAEIIRNFIVDQVDKLIHPVEEATEPEL